MATLYDSIKATDDLIAYWPLRSDGADHSGNGRNLTAYGTVAYNQPPMNKNIMPSMLTPANVGAFRIAQSTLPKIKAVEGWFRLAGAKVSQSYSAVVGLNQPAAGTNGRYMMFYEIGYGFCSYWQPVTAYTSYPSPTNNFDNVSVGPHHYVVQLNEAGTATDVYINGVKDSAMTVPVDVFLQAVNTYLSVGAFSPTAKATVTAKPAMWRSTAGH